MLLQHHRSRVCHKTFKNHSQAQRVFKTAPLYAVTNPEETAPQDIWTAFTSFFESLWNPSTNPDGSTVQKAGMSYVYDEDGTLIAQTLTGGAQSSWGQSARYVYLPTASGPMPVAAIYGTKHYAIQSDHLNTPRRLIQSDGQVAWQWAYSAFGDEKPTTAKTRFANADLNQSFGTSTVPAVTFNLRYPGQYFDQESGLHYNYHRSYSATVGRYTQSDPIGLDGGWNRFGYVDADPLSFTDPDGLRPYGSGNARQRRYDRRHTPPRPPSHDPSGAWQDAAGYFNDEGKYICLRWSCGDSNQCFANPYDRRGNLRQSTDFVPPATDPASPPAGCRCDDQRFMAQPGLWDGKDWLDIAGKTRNRWLRR